MSNARIFLLMVLLALPRLIDAQPANPLLETLSTKLGISTTQAGQGVGAVLAMARGYLPEQDYDVIAAAVPGASQLLKAATVQGVVTRPINDRDDLATVFDEIGLSSEAAANFVPAMRAWLDERGFEDAGDLVSRAAGVG